MKIETLYDNGVGLVNEDSLLVTNTMFGVFDGASGMEPYTDTEGKTGAAIASSLASAAFTGADKSLLELALDANDAIREAMSSASIDSSRKTALWATSGAVVRIGEETFDWLQIGDCLILVILKDGSYRLLVENYNHDLESLVLWQELAVKDTENIREQLTEQMLKVRNKVNIDYGDLNGYEGVEDFIKHGTASLSDVAHILLFTDGLYLPKEDPRETDDFATFVALYFEGGLQLIQDRVRQEEATDPKCWKYPRFKQYDDIAAVALTF